MYDIIFINTTEISSNTAIQTLTLATLDINQLNAYLNTYSQELVAAGSDEAEVVDDAYEMSSLMLQMLQLIQTSYQLAQQQQYYQMEYDTYYSQQQQLIYEIQQDNNQYQIDQLSNLLLDSKILYLQVLLSKYITEEYRQYNFWAAKDLDIPVIQSPYYSESFCEAASVAELEASQCKLCDSVQDQLNQYDPNQIDEKMTCSWTEYVITQEQYPDLFEQLQSTGSATFPVLLPESTVFWDVVTYYVYDYPNLVYNKITQSNTISDDI